MEAMRRTLVLTVGLALLTVGAIQAQWTSSRPDGHAPIGVMVDHAHEKGEIMLSYRYMYMDMVGNRDGTDRLSIAEILDANGQYGFMITPTRMPMQMHMLGVMYAPIDEVTLIASLPVVDLFMDHVTRAGGEFTTNSINVGDLRVGGMIPLAQFGDQSVHVTALVSLPVGAIDETDVTPASSPSFVLLPYPMQTGSGTFDLRPSLTYLGQTEWWSWGGQASAVIRTGTNDNDYSLGNRYSGTFWAARRFSRWVSASARIEGTTWDDIEGADPRLPGPGALVVPTARPDLRGGSRVDVGVGVNVYIRKASPSRAWCRSIRTWTDHNSRRTGL
jgi:hypothetical protein